MLFFVLLNLNAMISGTSLFTIVVYELILLLPIVNNMIGNVCINVYDCLDIISS